MKTVNELSLIKGSFNASDANEVLLTMINSKIAYHEKKILAMREHSGLEDFNSIARIAELRETASELRALVSFAGKSNNGLKITASVKIELEELSTV
ncbi:MAG: hypothetical protein J0M08_01870 [Bacteroidetes bacterium]|nr:hypothetical protein [Bacteroidota bacterium]